MALSATSMASKIKANIAAVAGATPQNNDPANATEQHEKMLVAFCQGIVDEITQNAVTTIDSEKIQ